MLYISTHFWVLSTPKAGQNLHFQQKKSEKMRKKQEICSKIHQKTVFLVCIKTLVDCFIPPKIRKTYILYYFTAF